MQIAYQQKPQGFFTSGLLLFYILILVED